MENAFDAIEEQRDTVAGLSFSNVTDSWEALLDGIDDNDDWCFKALIGRH